MGASAALPVEVELALRPSAVIEAWEAADLDEVRPHIARVAASVLSDAALPVVLAHLAGATQGEIAEARGTSQPAVHYVLFGRPGHGRGALERVTTALRSDPEIARIVADIEERRMAAIKAPKPTAPEWYRSITSPPRPERFVAYSVLFVANELADTTRRVHLNDLFASLPRAAVEHALPMLRALGFAVLEGTHLRIVRTPVEESTR